MIFPKGYDINLRITTTTKKHLDDELQPLCILKHVANIQHVLCIVYGVFITDALKYAYMIRTPDHTTGYTAWHNTKSSL